MKTGEILNRWFETRGWTPFGFQREVWELIGRGESGLLHCSTGAGKTYAVWLGALARALANRDRGGGLRVLWITPLRALAADTEAALTSALDGLESGWRVGRRTGDTSSSVRRKIAAAPPECLVTTPESLCLLLSQPGFLPHFSGVELAVVDEWHELLSTKRGVLTELALARVRAAAKQVAVWGLSATLGNTTEAARALGGYGSQGEPLRMAVVEGGDRKAICIETVLPDSAKTFPWAGHLGLGLLEDVVRHVRTHRTSIVFTNTRSQAELWYQSLVSAMPDWNNRIGLHHGSLDNEVRTVSEDGLRTGKLRVVVATSSLDLGVDFAPVDCVIQIGSPKGVARLLQRAGRSGHRPGAVSKIICVPANTFELVEIAAARELAAVGRIESRHPLRAPLDVLCQHLVTVAASGGFVEAALRCEVRGTHAYRDLGEAEWKWALDFAAHGGTALRAYPEFARMEEKEGRYELRESRLAARHRMAIGTITSDASIEVRFQNGGRLGHVEESFLAKIRPGDRFLFAGRCLALVRVRDLRATVRAAKGRPTSVPRWMGGKMPLSSCMSGGVRNMLHRAAGGQFDSPELARLGPVLRIQERLSKIPLETEFLIEQIRTREGFHLFFYPFEGRLVHEGLAALFAYRIAKDEPRTFTIAVNDYGFELLSATRVETTNNGIQRLLADHDLTDDILGSVHASEMAKRRFREIARIAGLVNEGIGRARKSTRQMTMSAGLLYDVFVNYDPENRFVVQATREVLEAQLEETRLRATMAALRCKVPVCVTADRPTPFAYPLFVERLREQLSTESLAARIRRIEESLEGAA